MGLLEEINASLKLAFNTKIFIKTIFTFYQEKLY